MQPGDARRAGARKQQRDDDAAGQREREARARRRSARSSLQLPQLVDVDRQAAAVHARRSTPRPTATSQAATTITMIAKIWPSPLPCMRLNAISARFAALSISSRQSRMTSGLRRVSTPPAPMQKTIADTTRYQPMFTSASRRSAAASAPCSRRRRAVRAGRPADGPRASCRCPAGTRNRSATVICPSGPRSMPAAAAGEHDGADGGDQQQERRDLERQQELRQQQLADLRRACRSRRRRSAPSLSIARRPVPSSAMTSSTKRQPPATIATPLQAAGPSSGRTGSSCPPM